MLTTNTPAKRSKTETKTETKTHQDAIGMLTADHKKVKKLFKEFEDVADSGFYAATPGNFVTSNQNRPRVGIPRQSGASRSIILPPFWDV